MSKSWMWWQRNRAVPVFIQTCIRTVRFSAVWTWVLSNSVSEQMFSCKRLHRFGVYFTSEHRVHPEQNIQADSDSSGWMNQDFKGQTKTTIPRITCIVKVKKFEKVNKKMLYLCFILSFFLEWLHTFDVIGLFLWCCTYLNQWIHGAVFIVECTLKLCVLLQC